MMTPHSNYFISTVSVSRVHRGGRSAGSVTRSGKYVKPLVWLLAYPKKSRSRTSFNLRTATKEENNERHSSKNCSYHG